MSSPHSQLGMNAHSLISVTQETEEDHKFKASLGNLARSYLKTKKGLEDIAWWKDPGFNPQFKKNSSLSLFCHYKPELLLNGLYAGAQWQTQVTSFPKHEVTQGLS